MEFKEIVKQRYATKKFDGRMIPEDKIEELLEMIRLSASSFNTQPWKIKIVKDKEMKELLSPATRNQPQILTCSHILIICADTNYDAKIKRLEHELETKDILDENSKLYLERLSAYIAKMSDTDKLNYAKNQVHIALGNAINGAKSLGLDSCAMGGFDAAEYSKILNIPPSLIPTIVIPLGYAAADDIKRPKIRISREDIIF